MNRPNLAVVHRAEVISAPISFAEKLSDHHAILQGYLDTHITRNHSELTLENARRFLRGWFEGFVVQDSEHPEGQRQLLIWEAMTPGVGRQRIVEFSKGLLKTVELKPRTVGGYLGQLRRVFQYALEYPYIPGESLQLIVPKYGRLEQPVLEYDYPSHVLDHEEEGFVLTGKRLLEFYDFIRNEYIPCSRRKLVASRNYTAVVVAAESGLRADEIAHLDCLKPHRDLFYEQGRIQTRYGKAATGSGKRIRKTAFTPFAQATVRVYEEKIRSGFPNAQTNPALFLSERGARLSYPAMWAALNEIAEAARQAGIDMPPKLGWHSLRKSFATNFLENNPDQTWLLMDMMGHLNPSTLHHYVKHSRSYYDQALDNIITKLVP